MEREFAKPCSTSPRSDIAGSPSSAVRCRCAQQWRGAMLSSAAMAELGLHGSTGAPGRRHTHHGRRHQGQRISAGARRASHGHRLLQRHDRHWRAAWSHRTSRAVPQDVSVVGFDDIHLAQFMLPPLTTVQMSCKHLAAGRRAGSARRHRAGHPQAQQREWHISTQLVVRQSTAFPRGSLPALAKTSPPRAAAPRTLRAVLCDFHRIKAAASLL